MPAEASPASGGSLTRLESGVSKQRRRRAASSDEDTIDSFQENGQRNDSEREKDKKKARGRRKRRTDVEGKSGNGGSGSVVWTILVIGLVFCLVDLIMGFVDRQDALRKAGFGLRTASAGAGAGTETETGSASATVSNPLAVKQPPPLPGKANKQAQYDSIPPPSPAQRKQPTSVAELIADKDPILKLVEEASPGILPFPLTNRTSLSSLSESQIELLQDLPTWSNVVELYGPEPRIVGLDQCEPFRGHSPLWDHFVSTAGTFNTGTNFMAELLIANCHMQDRMKYYGSKNRGVRWQVPWGKHTPPGDEEFRLSHKTQKDASVNASDILPAVTVRDPLVWLQSMCRHEYAAHWKHNEHNCPSFVNFEDEDLKTDVKYSDFTRHHDSIIHFWNDYYNEYLHVKFYRLIVRFEDLVYHPEYMTRTVCTCAGGSMRRDGRFIHVVDSAKKGDGAHGAVRTGYIDALVKYGSPSRRYKGYYSSDDLAWIRDHLDRELMGLFGYPPPDPSKAQTRPDSTAT